ncbi:sigma-54 dependent transcriptional regulator [Sphingomonas sp. KR1UV-12]|uniref:Sigma-54 dependent transcriptional regulator n=1 Tax=Sphingomonas aurea TaxID=3063994 RepID=A0ABT9EP43_9SPHN|nr:sigma-54 dependent transcriptional regulator [Sphingomonas sp. KR1UV-12]MDP1028576.1 sigma-54 dependent transcriptional regulator [Sphingomonas sp. KR1UV-12]
MSAQGRVALVEDDEDLRASTAQLLTLAGFAVDAWPAAPPALDAIDADFPGVVVTDIRMPAMSGLELFRTLHDRDPALPVILVTGHADVAMAVDALKAGAWDFLAKPFDPAALVAAVGRAMTARGLALDNRRLRAAAASTDETVAAGLIGRSPAIRRLREMVPVLADAGIDLFVEGETGTGKELLARLIHRAGRRARHRFVAVACAALPDAVIDGELFGGAGAGGVAASARGTLFLDDVDRASPMLQARLVPLVENRAVPGSGGRAPTPIDLRVIATGGEGGSAAMLPELFYRLAAVRLRLPPLRERREDVPLLFAHLVDASAARLRVPIPPLTAAARDRLGDHDWPGNVRELAHFADRFVLGLEDQAGAALPPAGTLPDRVAAFERDAIVEAVLIAGGETGAAMEQLGLPRKTFYYKVQRHGIDLAALRRRVRSG